MKQLYELSDFSGGIISNADLADIPDGAAEISLNISPMGKLGAIEPIRADLELMPKVPHITAMTVRDSLLDDGFNLAVNINENFISIPNYRSDIQLSDFVQIAEKGQLFEYTADLVEGVFTNNSNTDFGWWNASSSTYTWFWTIIETIPGYIYKMNAHCSTTSTTMFNTTSDMPILMANTPAVTSDGGLKPLTDTAHLEWSLTSDRILGYRSCAADGAREFNFTASGNYTVIAMRAAKASLGFTTTFADYSCEFYRGGYVWGPLGSNLDLTDTDKGLFIGSSTTPPHVQHSAKDDKSRVLNFLEKSECNPPVSATSMSNIDFMSVIPNKTDNAGGVADCHNLICGILGQKHLWAVARDYDTGAVANYTNFYKSGNLSFTDKGIGGIVVANEATHADSFAYCWDFEGWNIYKIKIPDGTGTSVDDDGWIPDYVETYSLAIEDLPTDGYIAKVVTSVSEGNNKLYALLTRTGGLKGGDNVLFEVDTATDGIKKVDDGLKVLYKLLNYKSVTAYTGHKYDKNWLGIKTDVNPTGARTLYWATSGQEPVPYVDGDYSDVEYEPTYGDVPGMCWGNTASDEVTVEVGENSLVCAEHPTSYDVLTFCLKPLGDTVFVENSGKWRKAGQWPNMWPNGDEPDGYWTDIVSNQVTTQSSMMISVAPQTLPTDDSVQVEFSTVDGDARERIDGILEPLNNVLNLTDWVTVPALVSGDYYESHHSTRRSLIYAGAGMIREQCNNTKLIELREMIIRGDDDVDIVNKCKSYYNDVRDWEGAWYVDSDDNEELAIWKYWDYIWHSSGDDFTLSWDNEDDAEFKSQMLLFKELYSKIAYANWIDTSKKTTGYHRSICHSKIGSNFPIEGGFDTMDRFVGPNDEERILCGKLKEGGVHFTTAEYSFGSGVITDSIPNTTFRFSDELQLTPNENDVWVCREAEFETSIDASGNVTRTATGEDATITEYAALIVGGSQKLSTSVEIPKTSDSGSYPSGSNPLTLSLAGTDNTDSYPSLLIASFTGDVLMRSWQFNNIVDAPISSPFDSGELSIGITPTAGDSFSGSSGDAPFLVNDTVMYNMSYLFDGYQEGPLMGSPVTYTVSDPSGLASVKLRVNLSTTNPRITAVNIYSKRDSREKYRLVKQVEIDNEWLVQDAEGMPDANLSSTAFMQAGIYTEVEDEGRAGVSYEALNGIPETLKNTMVNYSESEALSGYLFVANATHDSIDNCKKYIFRSQPNKYSVFNWSQDYIGLPETVHSLKSCYNRLFAFSNRTMYQIDPHNLIVESKFDGMGVGHQKSVVNCDGVLYIANRNGVYIYGGGKFQNITQTIKDDWDEIFYYYPSAIPILSSDKTYNSMLVMFDNAGTHSVDLTPSTGFSFSIDKRRWDKWELPRKIKSIANAENNTLLVSAESSEVAGYDQNGEPLTASQLVAYNLGLTYETIPMNERYSIYELHQGTQFKKISWRTKRITLGTDNRDKKFKRVKIKGKNVYISELEVDGVIYYFDVNGTMYSDANHSTQLATEQFKNDGQFRYVDFKKVGKYLQVKVDTITSGDDEDTLSSLESIALTYSLRSIK